MENMVISDENNANLNRPSSFQDMVGKKFGQEIKSNRRALGVINQGLVRANQPYPCVVNKRALPDKQEMCEKKQADPMHRPITRRFAAQIASTKSSSLEVKKKPSSNGFGESIFIDDEVECEAVMDHPVPMFLEEQSEEDELLYQTDDMEEVEMEDIEEDDEPIVDIDIGDKANPLAVVDYVDEIHAFYKKMEGFSCVAPNYMTHQHDINEKMRSILIDWLIEVHDKFDLMKETLFLTVNLIDRFLSKQTVVRKKLQLVGLVSMLLACKYEEVSVPVVGDLILISDKAYTRQDVLNMEQLMLNTLQFNMSVPTPYVFMKRFLKASQSDKKLENLSFFLIELSLVEYEMLKFPPSLLAASAIFTAQCCIYGFKHWNKTFEWHANYSQDQLLECSRLMVGYHQRASTGKLTGVHRKYSTSKFVYTSKCGAADFLLNTEDHL